MREICKSGSVRGCKTEPLTQTKNWVKERSEVEKVYSTINLDKINNKETITKTIRMEPDLIEKIEKLAEASERDFTKQVKFMLREYIRSREMK